MTTVPVAQHPVLGPQIQRLLQTARMHLGMDVAWVSHFDLHPSPSSSPDDIGRDEQVGVADQGADIQVIDALSGDGASMGVGVGVGTHLPRAGSYCTRVLAGALPAAIGDTRRHLIARDLPITTELGIGSYLGAPLRDRGGQVVGMVCCLGQHPTPGLGEQDVLFLTAIADVISDLLSDQLQDLSQERLVLHQQVQTLLDEELVQMVYQPIIRRGPGNALSTAYPGPSDRNRQEVGITVVGYEALARFPGTAFTRPDLAFAAAAQVGLGVQLEAVAAGRALQQLHAIAAGMLLTVNLSAEAITDSSVQDLVLRAAARARRTGRLVGVEVTEHTPVSDYDQLVAATGRLRAAGVYIAVDDAGAGYASFHHVLQLRPDIVKIDISLVRDIDTDPLRQALTRSLATFAHESSAHLIAEGVERGDEAHTLSQLGVRLNQGYLYGRPGPLVPSARLPHPSHETSRPVADHRDDSTRIA